jgi:Isochorismatase family
MFLQAGIAARAYRCPAEAGRGCHCNAAQQRFSRHNFHIRLSEAGVDRLVITGIQTEMCVDSTCRAAAALGYKVTLVSDAHTTFDSPVLPAEKIIAHHNRTLGDGFADVLCANDVD